MTTTPQQKDNGADAERAAFEAWVIKTFGYDVSRGPWGYYRTASVEMMWLAHELPRPAPVGTNVAEAGIDTPEFRNLFRLAMTTAEGLDSYSGKYFIAHINAWGARLAAGAPAETVKLEWVDDSAAHQQLRRNFIDTAGVLSPRDGYTPTERDMSAIDYLCNEWDYGYSSVTPIAPASQAVSSEATYRELMTLARRTLWIAYVWNDHNFGSPLSIARETCEALGIKSLDDANKWIEKLSATNAAAQASTPATPSADVVKDAARWDFLIKESCRVESFAGKYRVEWPDLDKAQAAWFDTPRAAIDSCIAAMGALPPDGEKA